MILNGELIREFKARVSPANRGMMYGDGCFETLRGYGGKFLRWDAHFARLEAGLSYLDMDTPFTSEELKRQISALLDHNQLHDEHALVRLQCWRDGDRGYATTSRKSRWMIQASKIGMKSPPLRLMVAETRCISSKALDRQYKLSNGLNYVKAAQEASKAGADNALMLTIQNKVSETTSANIFWVKEGQVFTPDVSCDLLPGVTRSAVLDVLKKLSIPIETGGYELPTIYQAEAVFCTNSLIEIREITEIENNGFELAHPLVEKIKAGFEQLKKEELRA